MTFCPRAVEWGTVADWVSGIGTAVAAFIAVGALLWQLRTHNQRVESERRSQARLVYVSEADFGGIQVDGDQRWPRVRCKLTNASSEVITHLVFAFRVEPQMLDPDDERDLGTWTGAWTEMRVYPGETKPVDVRLDKPLPPELAEGDVIWSRRSVNVSFFDGADQMWMRNAKHKLIAVRVGRPRSRSLLSPVIYAVTDWLRGR